MIQLPSLFRERMQLLLGDEIHEFENSMNKSRATAFRLNLHKRNVLGEEVNVRMVMEDLVSAASEGVSDEYVLSPVKWCDDAWYVAPRPAFILSPLFHAGAYYVQEPAAMIYQLIAQRLLQKGYVSNESHILDVCAAPGGKSTSLLNALGEKVMLVANEYDNKRVNILYENLAKWGNENVIITQGNTQQYKSLKGCFDLVAVDAPCSGEGMMRKEEVAVTQWSERLIENCVQTQKEILSNVVGALKEDGILIYSTCTYNLEENEEIVKWLIETCGLESLDLGINEDYHLPESFVPGIHAVRFFPHLTESEGQFAAVLQKKRGEDDVKKEDLFPNRVDKKRNKEVAVSKKTAEMCTEFLDENSRYELKRYGDTITAMSRKVVDMLEKLNSAGVKNVKSAGVQICTLKGELPIPATELATSGIFNKNIPYENLDYPTALSYLRRESIFLKEGVKKGYVIVGYKGFPLGFVKNIGNRANNLYPKTWQIRQR